MTDRLTLAVAAVTLILAGFGAVIESQLWVGALLVGTGSVLALITLRRP